MGKPSLILCVVRTARHRHSHQSQPIRGILAKHWCHRASSQQLLHKTHQGMLSCASSEPSLATAMKQLKPLCSEDKGEQVGTGVHSECGRR